MARRTTPAKARTTPEGGYYLNDDQVKKFWGYMEHWKIQLGLSDWRITYKVMDGKGKFMSKMDKWDFTQRQVRCTLSTSWSNSEPTEVILEQTAVHELWHVRLGRLIELAKTPNVAQEDLDFEEHGVINMVEKLLVPGGDGH